MSDIAARGYAHPEVLVSTDWVEQHLKDDSVRLIESNEDTLLYSAGHVPGAVHVDWTSDLNDQLRRDYITRAGFEQLMSRIGATKDTTVVFYGDKNNWWACYAFWVFQLFGHTNARVMDGGRVKWQKENRPLTRDVPNYPPTSVTGPSAKRCSRTSSRAASWWTCAAPRNMPARACTCPTTPMKARYGADTSPARRASPGQKPSTRTMERSRRRTNCESCTATTTSCSRSSRRSPTAVSASATAPPGFGFPTSLGSRK